MKISGINNVQNGNFVDKTDSKIEQKPLETKNQKEITPNSLSEAIGRSQVAFKGINKIDKTGTFKHECVEKGEKENITYDPKTGNFKHEKYSKKGDFLSSIEYDNATQTRIITEKIDNGKTEVITEAKDKKTTQIFNSNGKPLKEIIEPSFGSPQVTTWDYNKGRKFVTQFNKTRVYDLKTDKEVFFGDLVYVEKDDKIKNKKATVNIRTGKVIKEEFFDKKGNSVREIEYDEASGEIIKRTDIGKKSGEYRTLEYDKKNFRLTKDINSTNKGRNVRTKQYNPYTTKLTSDFEEIFNGDILIGEIEYYLGTDNAKISKVYNEETCEISYFGLNGNIEKFEVREDGAPIQVDIYNKETGKKVKSTYIDYNRKKKIIDTYNVKGNVRRRTVESTVNGFLLEETLFGLNGKPVKTTKWNELSQERQTEYYDENGIRTKKVEIDYAGRPSKETNFYSDGETAKDEKLYYPNGEYIYSEFNENGKIKKVTFFDKYGREKDSSSSQTKSRSNDFRSNSTTKTTAEEERAQEIQFLKKVLNAVSSRRDDAFYKLKDSAWQTLAQILGCEDYKLLKEGDKKEYIRLIKQYHPDLYADKEKGEIIAQILNGIQDFKNSNN